MKFLSKDFTEKPLVHSSGAETLYRMAEEGRKRKDNPGGAWIWKRVADALDKSWKPIGAWKKRKLTRENEPVPAVRIPGVSSGGVR